MRKSILAVIVAGTSLCSTCKQLVDHTPALPYYVGIKNDTSIGVFVTVSYNYPDLSLPAWDNNEVLKILPQDSNSLHKANSWKSSIATNLHDTLILFYINADTLTKYGYNSTGWNRIKADNNIAGYRFISSPDVNSQGSVPNAHFP